MINPNGMIGVERATKARVRACICLISPTESSTIIAPKSSDTMMKLEENQRESKKLDLR